MATIPFYDVQTLPCITYPMENIKEATKKYLGRRAFTGRTLAGVSVFAKSDTEINNLYKFWRDDCNYGLEPFLIPIPVFGEAADASHPAILAKFIGEFKATNSTPGIWDQKFTVEILGNVDYVIDDQGNYVVSDTGDFVIVDGNYVATGNNINSYKEVIYAN